jgi:hypothetical protein
MTHAGIPVDSDKQLSATPPHRGDPRVTAGEGTVALCIGECRVRTCERPPKSVTGNEDACHDGYR